MSKFKRSLFRRSFAHTVKLQEKLYAPLHEKRDAIVNKVDGFWQQAVSSVTLIPPMHKIID